MAVSKPVIERLAERAMEAKGLAYFEAYQALKEYIHSLPEHVLIREIERITNPLIFPKLWACGLSWDAQIKARQRWEELTK